MMLQKLNTAPAGQRAFDLFGFLAGETRADGLFEDRFGRVRKRFTAQMTGTLAGNELKLDEDFLFSDGTTLQRTWTLYRQDEETFKASCVDAIGEAQGRLLIGGATMDYGMKLDIGPGRSLAVRFDDAFYAMNDNTVMNRARVIKWGVRIGQVLIVLSKPQDHCART
jgi:hypothetical protein